MEKMSIHQLIDTVISELNITWFKTHLTNLRELKEKDAVESQNGGWVGLSDIASLGNGEFLMLERDNQGTADVAIKRLYRFDINGLVEGNTVTKTLVRDLIREGDLTATGGAINEKIEGLAVMLNNSVYIVNDNDGVDGSNGETLLINLGQSILD